MRSLLCLFVEGIGWSFFATCVLMVFVTLVAAMLVDNLGNAAQRVDAAPMDGTARFALALLAASATIMPLAGCADFGHAELGRDQLGYAQVLTEAQKEQTLLNIVRLRYGNIPVFLNATQVIAGYQLQRNIAVGTQIFPSAALSTFASGNAGLQLQQSPTFTFQPVGGKDFTESYIRPLSPTGLYPLTIGNLPIDVLLRLTVTSIGPLRNVNVFAAPEDRDTKSFFVLLRDLRRLQLAGAVELRLSGGEADGKDTVSGDRLTLVFRKMRGEEGTEREVKRLLALPDDVAEADVVYGVASPMRGAVPIVTRSILGIMAAVAFDVEVPDADVAAGVTIASITRKELERRPAVLIVATPDQPPSAFVSVLYRDRWFSIGDGDFDSKVAFGVLQLLISLGQSPQGSNTIVTVPAR